MSDSAFRPAGGLTLDLPPRVISPIGCGGSLPRLVAFDGLRLSVLDPMASSVLHESPFSDDSGMSFIVPIQSRSLILVSKDQQLLLGFDLKLNPVHSIDLDIFAPTASVIFCEQDSTLFLSVETGMLKAVSLRPDLAWSPRWCQRAPAVRNLTRGRHRLFGSVLTTVYQWNCENGNLISTFDASHSSDILSLKCSRDHVITASGDGFVKAWSIADRKLTAVLEQRKCDSIEVEVDETSLFVLSSEKILRRYDLKSFRLAAEQDLSGFGISMMIWQSFLILTDCSAVSVLGVPALKAARRSAFPRLVQCNSGAGEIPKSMPPQATLRDLTDHRFYDAFFALNVQHANLTRPVGVPKVNRSAVDHRKVLAPLDGRSSCPGNPIAKSRSQAADSGFSKQSFLAKLDAFGPIVRVSSGVSYTNGRVVPFLKSFQPHMGVLNSVIREKYVHQLFIREEHEALQMPSSAEFFFDLLNGKAEYSQKLLRRSRWVRNKAAATLENDAPLENFLRTTPNLSRSQIQDVTLEMRQEHSNLGQSRTSPFVGDSWPSIDRRELLESNFRVVSDVRINPTTELEISGLSMIMKLVSSLG
jgi:hypothetical protein